MRKRWVPVEVGLGALMLKTGRGPKKLLGLLIGEIQNNDHKAIILFSFVVCIRRQGGGGGGGQRVPRGQPPRGFPGVGEAVAGALRGGGGRESAWEVGTSAEELFVLFREGCD